MSIKSRLKCKKWRGLVDSVGRTSDCGSKGPGICAASFILGEKLFTLNTTLFRCKWVPVLLTGFQRQTDISPRVGVYLMRDSCLINVTEIKSDLMGLMARKRHFFLMLANKSWCMLKHHKCKKWFFQAVCCKDEVHCCPSGNVCDLSSGTCEDGFRAIPWAVISPWFKY